MTGRVGPGSRAGGAVPAPSAARQRSARTLVILPAYNEEAALSAVLKELAAICPQLDVLVVDDGSTDRTAEVARAEGVPVAVLPFNLGVGGALQTGFRYAVAHGYGRAIQFDADGQHDPSQVPALLAALDEGADLVIGSRFAAPEAGLRVRRRPPAGHGHGRAPARRTAAFGPDASPTPRRGSGPSPPRCSTSTPPSTPTSTWATPSRPCCWRARPGSAWWRCR